jgi:hypothetical protein
MLGSGCGTAIRGGLTDVVGLQTLGLDNDEDGVYEMVEV